MYTLAGKCSLIYVKSRMSSSLFSAPVACMKESFCEMSVRLVMKQGVERKPYNLVRRKGSAILAKDPA